MTTRAIIAGAIGTRINKPLNPEGSRLSGGLLRALAVLWPWSLTVYVLWVLGLWVIGYSYNEWLLAHSYLIIFMVLGTLPRLSSLPCLYLIDFLNAEVANHIPRPANAATTSQHNHRGSGSPPARATGSLNIICRTPSMV